MGTHDSTASATRGAAKNMGSRAWMLAAGVLLVACGRGSDSDANALLREPSRVTSEATAGSANAASTELPACLTGTPCGANEACVNGVCTGFACRAGEQQVCFSGPPNALGVGACAPGVKTCNAQGNGFGACVGERLPTTEVCGDGVDNDCNGTVDDASCR